MKTLTETLNGTLENTLQLEIAKILSDEQQVVENKTTDNENSN